MEDHSHPPPSPRHVSKPALAGKKKTFFELRGRSTYLVVVNLRHQGEGKKSRARRRGSNRKEDIQRPRNFPLFAVRLRDKWDGGGTVWGMMKKEDRFEKLGEDKGYKG